MIRKSVIMMALATAFTINVSAVQIEVPAGQPPMPGADASIPTNAYEDYRHINKVAEQENGLVLLRLRSLQIIRSLQLCCFMKGIRISDYPYQMLAYGVMLQSLHSENKGPCLLFEALVRFQLSVHRMLKSLINILKVKENICIQDYGTHLGSSCQIMPM